MSQAVGKNFRKAYVLFQFCNGSGGLTGFTASHVDIRCVPTIWLKTVPKRAKTAFFWCFGWGIAIFGRRGTFLGWDCSSDTELQTNVGVFENSSNGPSTVALSIGVYLL